MSEQTMAERIAAVTDTLVRRGHHVCADGRIGVEAAVDLIGLTKGTLYNLRSKGKGPLTVKIGRVWYSIEWCLNWLDGENRITEFHQTSRELISSD